MTSSAPLFDINQLNPEQQNKFRIVYDDLKSRHASYLQFKSDLQIKSQLTAEEEESEWCYEIHRHLRARKWNMAHTVKSLLNMIQWRIDNRVDLILEHAPTKRLVDLLQKIVPFVYHGYTKANRPLYIEKSGLMIVDRILTMFTPEELLQCHIYVLEFICQLARERSREVGQHIESFTLLSDLQGCKLDLRKVLHLYRQALFVDEHYYPERLGQMFVVNPPNIFPILWNLVKHWLDPVTKTKIMVLRKGAETFTALLENIDTDQLPEEYGGKCNTCSAPSHCIPIYDWSQHKADDVKQEE